MVISDFFILAFPFLTLYFDYSLMCLFWTSVLISSHLRLTPPMLELLAEFDKIIYNKYQA